MDLPRAHRLFVMCTALVCVMGLALATAQAPNNSPFVGVDAQGNLDLRAPANKTVMINGADFAALLQQLNSLSAQVRVLQDLQPPSACVPVANATAHGRGAQQVIRTSAGWKSVICTDLGYQKLYNFGTEPQIGPAPGISNAAQLRATFPRIFFSHDCITTLCTAGFTATILKESFSFYAEGFPEGFIEFTLPADGSTVWIKVANLYGQGTGSVRLTVGGVVVASLSYNQVFDAAVSYKNNDTVRVEEINASIITLFYVLYK